MTPHNTPLQPNPTDLRLCPLAWGNLQIVHPETKRFISPLLLLGRSFCQPWSAFLRNLRSTARSHTRLGISKQACAGTINTCGDRFPARKANASSSANMLAGYVRICNVASRWIAVLVDAPDSCPARDRAVRAFQSPFASGFGVDRASHPLGLPPVEQQPPALRLLGWRQAVILRRTRPGAEQQHPCRYLRQDSCQQVGASGFTRASAGA